MSPTEFSWTFLGILPVLKDLVITIAAGVAAYVGIMGIGSWRRQLSGNTEYRLAKDILISVYEIREAIKRVRWPFMTFSKDPNLSDEENQNLPYKERQWRSLIHTFQLRWDPVSTVTAKMNADLIEAEVIWGPDIQNKTQSLHKLIGELRFAVQDHIDRRSPNEEYEGIRLEGEEYLRRQDVLFGAASKESKFTDEIDEAISGLNDVLRPFIETHHTGLKKEK